MQSWITNMLIILTLLLFCSTLCFSSECLQTKNIACTCNETSSVCSGIQEELPEVQYLLSNLSISYASTDLLDLTLNITDLSFLPDYSFHDFKLEKLRLGNGLRNVYNDLFSGLELSLLSLNLQHNDIEFAGQPLSSLQNLKELNLDYNDLQEIDVHIFYNLSKLEFLSLSGNNINSLDIDFLKSLTSIQTLVLNENDFSSISDINIASSTLTKLFVQNSSINGSLQRDSLSNVNNLRYADLSFNHLLGVDSLAFSQLHYLEILNLSNNKLEYLRNNAFSSMFNLKDLDLKDNKLSHIEEKSFLNLTNLKTLDLSGNLIEAILYQYTLDLHSLEKINLQNNKIQIITANTFYKSTNLQELLLEGNILDCSCELSYLAGFLINSTLIKPENVNGVICSSPQAMKGTRLIDVDFNSMNCEFSELEDPVSEGEDDYDEDSSDSPYIQNNTLLTSSTKVSTKAITTDAYTITSTELSYTTSVIADITTENATLVTEVKTQSSTEEITTNSSDLFSAKEEISSTTSLTGSEITSESTETTTTNSSSIFLGKGQTTSTVSPITTQISSKSTDATTTSPSSLFTTKEETTSAIPLTSNKITSKITDTITESTTLDSKSSTLSSTTYSTSAITTTKLADSKIVVNILNSSISDKNLCVRWNISGSFTNKPKCSLEIQSKSGKKFKNLKCPTSGNEIQECVAGNHSIVYDICVHIFVTGGSKIKECKKVQMFSSTKAIASSITTEAMPVTSMKMPIPVTTEKIPESSSNTISISPIKSSVVPFKILKFDVTFNHSHSFATVLWDVNRYETNSVCNLTLILTTHYYNYTIGVFNCRNNTYKVFNVEDHETLQICLVTFYEGYDTSILCNSSMVNYSGYKASRTKDDGYKNSSLIAVVCLLIIVVIIIIAIILKNLLKKRTESDMYNVSAEEKNVLRKMSSHFPQEPCVRYSYTLKENVEV